VCKYTISVTTGGCGHLWTDNLSINCGNSVSGGGTCSEVVSEGTSVTLHGTPNYYYGTTGVGWSASPAQTACSGNVGDCVFTPTANTTLSRTFDVISWDPSFDTTAGQGTFSNGNLTVQNGASVTTTLRTLPTNDEPNNFVPSGAYSASHARFYWEINVNNGGNSANWGGLGLIDSTCTGTAGCATSYAGFVANGLSFGYSNSYLYTDFASLVYHDSTTVSNTLGTAYYLSPGDTYMFALDMATGYLWIGWDGAWTGNTTTTSNPSTYSNPTISGIATTESIYPSATLYAATHNTPAAAMKITANFGCTPFSYAPTGW
jgi:hypothetical protein